VKQWLDFTEVFMNIVPLEVIPLLYFAKL